VNCPVIIVVAGITALQGAFVPASMMPGNLYIFQIKFFDWTRIKKDKRDNYNFFKNLVK
jgi:uncharacterized membrane protein YoaK (UPF0700 family)